VGLKNVLGKALIADNGCSLIKINNAAKNVFHPIKEALEPSHFVVPSICKGITIAA